MWNQIRTKIIILSRINWINFIIYNNHMQTAQPSSRPSLIETLARHRNQASPKTGLNLESIKAEGVPSLKGFRGLSKSDVSVSL